MADVVRKIISGNDVKNNGTTVTGVTPTGQTEKVNSDIPKNTDLTLVENKLTSKFNKDYYNYNT